MDTIVRSDTSNALPPADGHHNDRTLHWTLSLRIGPKKLEGLAKWGRNSSQRNAVDDSDPDRRVAYQRALQDRFPGSDVLRDAMEPMFNDVTDRERLGIVEDFLLAIDAAPVSEGDEPNAPGVDNPPPALPPEPMQVDFIIPDSVRWSTENTDYTARFDNHAETLPADIHRFWYVHRDDSLSYHITFTIRGYSHSPRHFFFISLLQKLAAPKEFRLPGKAHEELTAITTPNLAPFKLVQVLNHGIQLDFWRFLTGLFNADFEAFHRKLTDYEYGRSAWDHMLTQEHFIDVPRLKMPHIRTMFYFEDELFLRLILPANQADGKWLERHNILDETFFDVDLQRQLNDPAAVKPQPDKSRLFDAIFWGWLADPSRSALRKLDDVRINSPQVELDNTALCYLFLAGFNQNIIDFLNQDSSEVLDSLDPIYPIDETDREEALYARFGNPRSLITYVRHMRSLDTGDRYIGTCPYAFMIHVLGLHNEFLVRDFEITAESVRARAKAVLDKAENNGRLRGDTSRAVEEIKGLTDDFYVFRRGARLDYDTHHYRDVFRYDTESKVFQKLEEIRGTELKHKQVLSMVDNMERVTHDLEARLDALEAAREGRRDQNMTLALLVIGVFAAIPPVAEAVRALGPEEWGGKAYIALTVLAVILLGYVLTRFFTIQEV